MEADLVCGNGDRKAILDNVLKLLDGHERIVAVTPHQRGELFEELPVERFETHTRAFIKVEDGCNRQCASTPYYYSVQAVSTKWGGAIKSSYDKNFSVTTNGIAPTPTPAQTVKPKTPAVTVTAGKKQATLKWKKVSGAKGYVVYRATSKSGKYKAVSTIKKGSTVSYINKKLTSKKTYYYKVRAYRTENGKRLYSSYSKAKSAKIK